MENQNNHSSTPPKVSVCIPAFCQVEYLQKTLESLLDQSFNDYELIITDDSPDDSVYCLLQSLDFRGKLRYQRNTSQLGSPRNWNAAVHLAKGEYVKILHHDDYLSHPNALQVFVDMLDNNPNADFAFSSTIVKDVKNGLSRIHTQTQAQLTMLSERPEILFFGNFIGAPSATIYRRSIDLEYDEEMKWLVDIDFYIRVLYKNPNFATTSEALVTTPTNAIHQVTEICRDNAIVELTEYYRLFSKLAPRSAHDLNIKLCWWRLFAKYKIRTMQDFKRYDLPTPKPEEYFESVLRFTPFAKLIRAFYFAEAHSPQLIRQFLRRTVRLIRRSFLPT